MLVYATHYTYDYISLDFDTDLINVDTDSYIDDIDTDADVDRKQMHEYRIHVTVVSFVRGPGKAVDGAMYLCVHSGCTHKP